MKFQKLPNNQKNMENKEKTKILIVGLGGVGGFFGGLLAGEFANSEKVEIYFLARGAHLEAIQSKGLSVHWGGANLVVHPKLATDSIAEIGKMDYVIICTKTYDLETVCQQIIPCIHPKTVILPLLNGVDNHQTIRNHFKNNRVLLGCVYLVSSIVAPGGIENSGNIQSLFFGDTEGTSEREVLLLSILKQAGIEAVLSGTIERDVWEKYIFLSAIATATSYFDCSIGELLEAPSKKEKLHGLVAEIIEVAKALSVDLDGEIALRTYAKFQSLPAHITSSMHRDFISKNKRNELEALTGFVVKKGVELGIETPIFKKLYEALKKKTIVRADLK